MRQGVLVAAWLALGAVFAVRARLKLDVRRRSWTSLIGLAIQAFAFSLVWAVPRAALSETTPPSGAWALWLAAPILAGSVWLMAAAVRTLGRQWSLAAEIQARHALITAGPYAHVRHPIYVGTLGMLIGTGLILTTPTRYASAVAIYLAGTWIRVREEERLLHDAFGEEYERYRRWVKL